MGTEAGTYLISGPGWEGEVPLGASQIFSPNKNKIPTLKAILTAIALY